MSSTTVAVRPARASERVDVLSVLDAAMLETDAEALADHIDAGSVLVAVTGERSTRVLGVMEARETESGAHIEGVAVRRKRRNQGIGTALVEAAAERWRPLTADFDAAVRPFYEALGFDVVEADDGRYRGCLH
ncbi:N-acetyltransferase [Halarchaeum grantii]|uniref:N-acetyltransferase n=1 Tax=Halarchaeum grantii TaxID=1193105 RepID=A0A830EVW4_9EURY|nr:GNAT family N-acetyltransferase [Halarchaeum grantii]GGL29844.1 N-acetyltransferase [Halarchaeum grantii]